MSRLRGDEIGWTDGLRSGLVLDKDDDFTHCKMTRLDIESFEDEIFLVNCYIVGEMPSAIIDKMPPHRMPRLSNCILIDCKLSSKKVWAMWCVFWSESLRMKPLAKGTNILHQKSEGVGNRKWK